MSIAPRRAVRPQRSPRHDYYEGIPRLGRPPSALRTPLFARHSRQITTQKSVFLESGDRSHWRWRVSYIAEQVYYRSSSSFHDRAEAGSGACATKEARHECGQKHHREYLRVRKVTDELVCYESRLAANVVDVANQQTVDAAHRTGRCGPWWVSDTCGGSGECVSVCGSV